MKIICITGGMGSGKSVVAKIFETIGYPVYYSDEHAKQMYFIPEIKQQIIEILGNEAYLSDTQINKSFISSKIFTDKNLLSEVNQIIHNAVKKDFEKFISQQGDKALIFKESALIFEAGIQSSCDKIILVTAPESLKIKRVKQRDNLTEEEIVKRMQYQWDDEKKIPLSDYVIINDNQTPVLPQILRILDDLSKVISG